MLLVPGSPSPYACRSASTTVMLDISHVGCSIYYITLMCIWGFRLEYTCSRLRSEWLLGGCQNERKHMTREKQAAMGSGRETTKNFPSILLSKWSKHVSTNHVYWRRINDEASYSQCFSSLQHHDLERDSRHQICNERVHSYCSRSFSGMRPSWCASQLESQCLVPSTWPQHAIGHLLLGLDWWCQLQVGTQPERYVSTNKNPIESTSIWLVHTPWIH
jgi:hypothetical protein